MRLAILTFFLVLLGLSPAMAGGVDEQRSGKGWVQFHPIATSPDYAFLRSFAETREDYEQSKEQLTWAWEIDDLLVGYWDLNDDGVEEMFLSYKNTQTSYFCGNSTCPVYFFEKRGGQWHEIPFGPRGDFVSDEKIGGHRTLYDFDGFRYRWSGTEYIGDCPEDAPADISDDLTSTCFRHDRWLREKNEPREPWPPLSSEGGPQ